MTSRAVGSASKASRRCSNVTYSCCRVVASATARFRVFSSSLVIILFHRAQQRKLISLSNARDFIHLHLSDFIRVDASQTQTLSVYVQHDLNGITLAVIEHSLQDEDDKLHRGEIVIMQQDLIKRRPLELRLALGLFYNTVFKLLRGHTANLTTKLYLSYVSRRTSGWFLAIVRSLSAASPGS